MTFSLNKVARIAVSIPRLPRRLPLTAVLGWLRPLRPRIKRIIEIK